MGWGGNMPFPKDENRPDTLVGTARVENFGFSIGLTPEHVPQACGEMFDPRVPAQAQTSKNVGVGGKRTQGSDKLPLILTLPTTLFGSRHHGRPKFVLHLVVGKFGGTCKNLHRKEACMDGAKVGDADQYSRCRPRRVALTRSSI